jgi:hypothetical protein
MKGIHHGRNRMVEDLQLPTQAKPIITNVVSWNTAQGQHERCHCLTSNPLTRE